MSNSPSSPSPTAGSSDTTKWVIGAVAIVVLVAIGAAVLLSGGDDETVTAGPDGGQAPSGDIIEYAPVRIFGDPLPPLIQGEDDTAIGSPAPEIEGLSFDSSPANISFDGRPKVVMFLAHWCPNCQNEKPKLEDWLNSGAKRDDVDVYTVATAQSASRPNWPPSAWLSGFPATVVMDDEESSAAVAFGLTAYPYTVVINSSGEVVQRFSGEADQVLGMEANEAFVYLTDVAAGDAE